VPCTYEPEQRGLYELAIWSEHPVMVRMMGVGCDHQLIHGHEGCGGSTRSRWLTRIIQLSMQVPLHCFWLLRLHAIFFISVRCDLLAPGFQ
jgi:hypothetical protein